MASREIDRLRKKYINKFFVRTYGRGNVPYYDAAFVMAVKYYKKNHYVIYYMNIHVDESFCHTDGGFCEENRIVIITRYDNDRMDCFIDTYQPRGNKWAEGFMEKMLDELKEFGKGVIDV